MKFDIRFVNNVDFLVTPCAGVWIEMSFNCRITERNLSLPVRECGLKSAFYCIPGSNMWSLPVRECGLKFLVQYITPSAFHVTPCAGVWIEIHTHLPCKPNVIVTPCAGVWIEISLLTLSIGLLTSLPVRECGLKSDRRPCNPSNALSLPVRECGLKYTTSKRIG